MFVHTCSNRSVPVSKLEVLFEAETLAEKDKFDEGTDVSFQAPALHRLGGKILKKRHSKKVGSKIDIHGNIATFFFAVHGMLSVRLHKNVVWDEGGVDPACFWSMCCSVACVVSSTLSKHLQQNIHIYNG